MKHWWTRFQIARSLDDRRPLSPAGQRRVAQTDDLSRFQADGRALDHALRQAPELKAVPADSLHGDIMRAIRRSAAEQPEPAARLPWMALPMAKWLLAPGLALLAIGLIWLTLQPRFRSGNTGQAPAPMAQTAGRLPVELGSPFALVQQARERSSDLGTQALTQEMDNLVKDVKKTTEFLLASWP